MSNAIRKNMSGRGVVGKTAVVGIKDRDSNHVSARVIESTDAATLQGFVIEHTDADTMVCTDEATAYVTLPFRLSRSSIQLRNTSETWLISMALNPFGPC